MSDYNAVYDAVRSKMSYVDMPDAVERALDFSYAQQMAANAFQTVEAAMTKPSVVYRPVLSQDGNKWIALLGANLQEGVVGIGDSPHEAMTEFDKAWFATQADT